jgi:hypothetical protein
VVGFLPPLWKVSLLILKNREFNDLHIFLSTICDFLFTPYKTIGDMKKRGPRKVDEFTTLNLVEMLRMAMEDLHRTHANSTKIEEEVQNVIEKDLAL